MRNIQIRRLVGIAVLLASLVLLGWSTWPAPMHVQTVELPGAQQLEMQWPVVVRLGETAEIRLELAGSANPGSAAAVELLTARLDLPGLAYTPSGEATQARSPERTAVFRWTLRADQPGNYAGTVWLYSGTTAGDARRVVSAQRFALQAGSFLGLSARWAQAFGLAGSVIGAVFGLDGVVFWFSRRFIIQ